MTRSMSHATRVGIGATSGSAATKELFFLECSLGKSQGLMDPGGIGGGTRSRRGEGIATDIVAVAGQLVLQPRPDEMDLLWPWILGGTESTDSFPLADAIKNYGVDIDKVEDGFRYASVVVGSAALRSTKSDFLTLTLNLVGKTETGSITFPSILSTLSTKRPYRHHEGTFTLGNTERKCNSIELLIDNQIQADFYENSETLLDVESGDRIVQLTIDSPYDSTHSDLVETAIAGITTNTLVWTDGTDTLTIALNNLKAATVPLTIPRRPGEVRLSGKTFQSYQTTTNKEIVVTSTNSA